MLLAFEGLERPVLFAGCDELVAHLRGLLRGWHFQEAEGGNAEPMLAVRRLDGAYGIAAPWRDGPYFETSPVGAVCTLLVDLVEAYVRSDPARLCLHCGAAEIGGRLVVFPAASRAGKSTLMARLAAAGTRVFTDDLLPLDAAAECGFALGVPPRLRLPLPRTFDPSFRSFLERYAGLSDPYYRYLDLPETVLAPFGSRAPLGAVVLLARGDAGNPARLEPASRARALRLLIGQSLTGRTVPTALVQALHRLVERAPCLLLRYGEIEQAAVLLQHRFQAWPEQTPAPATSIRLVPTAEGGEPVAWPGPDRFERMPTVNGRVVEDRLFLSDAAGGPICELDTLGAGIWNLLAEPISPAEAAALLCRLFPEVASGRIEADVARLFAELERQGLIRAYGEGKRPPSRSL